MPDIIPTPEVSPSLLTELKTKIAEIVAALLPKSPGGQGRPQGVSARRLPFVIRGYTLASNTARSVPPSVDLNEWRVRKDDYLAYDELEGELMKALAEVRSRKGATGAVIYRHARKYYSFVMGNLDQFPELREGIDELGELYDGQGGSEEEDDADGAGK